MAYGAGKRLGETIDPRLMMADFSGVERAGQAIGQGFANVGAQVGEIIKKRNENEKEIAGGIKMATAMKKAIPPLGEMADEVINNLSNPDLSTKQKLIALSGVKEAMQMSLLGNQENRAEAALKIQQDQLALEAAKIKASLSKGSEKKLARIGTGNGEIDVLIDDRGNITDISGNPIPGLKTQTPKGAGVNIQNALPQGQGGNFPDGVPTTGLPIEQSTESIPGVSAVDGSKQGVLPPIKPSEIPVYGIRNPEKKVTPPQEVTLPDGRKAFGSFVDGNFVPSTVDGKPMVRNLPVTEMTIEDHIANAPISISLLSSTPYSEMAKALEQKLMEAVAKDDKKAIVQISTYANNFLNTIKASPLSTDAGKLTKVQEKIAGQEEVAKLIAKGDKARALATYNALAIGQGFYGGSAISMDEFERQIQAGEFNFQDLQDQKENLDNKSISPEEEKLNELKSQFTE